MSLKCWKCGAEAEPPTCPSCGALQRPQTTDHFALFGFERRYDLSPEAVEERRRELSRLVHPDRFATATPEERRLSLLWATAVNDAAKVLKHPVRRAEYLLALDGIEARPEEAKGGADPAFLMEMLELRESLQAAVRRDDAAGVAALKGSVGRRRAALLDEIAAGFAALRQEHEDGAEHKESGQGLSGGERSGGGEGALRAGPSGGGGEVAPDGRGEAGGRRAERLRAIATMLGAVRYLDRFLEEAEAYEDRRLDRDAEASR